MKTLNQLKEGKLGIESPPGIYCDNEAAAASIEKEIDRWTNTRSV